MQKGQVENQASSLRHRALSWLSLTHRPRPQADNDYTLAANLCALSPYYLLLFMPFPLFTSFSPAIVAAAAHTPFCGMQKWTPRPLLALPPQSTTHTIHSGRSCHFECPSIVVLFLVFLLIISLITLSSGKALLFFAV